MTVKNNQANHSLTNRKSFDQNGWILFTIIITKLASVPLATADCADRPTIRVALQGDIGDPEHIDRNSRLNVLGSG
jgi:hypothetical protein